jgi:hypothetical protein
VIGVPLHWAGRQIGVIQLERISGDRILDAVTVRLTEALREAALGRCLGAAHSR